MEKIGNVTLNMNYYVGKDLYSDGEIEEKLLKIVQEFPENEYEQIIRHEQSWPVLYHLSKQRENILEWYPFNSGASVLEIGAGCGAVTGTLIRNAKRVVALDLSKRRSLINAYRHKNASNLEIIIGNFNEIHKHIKERFDYITLIGVFEYAESYMQDRDAHAVFLEKVNGLLKEQGKLLIAIENRLGLKYFAGCQEDHVGKYFEGIEGYKTTTGVRTFCKNELIQLFQRCGFHKYDFYYPYPDYKFPVSIYSDKFLPEPGELMDNIRNFDSNRFVVFDETKAYDALILSGMFQEFTNSFFVAVDRKG